MMTKDEMRQKLWLHIKQTHGTGLVAAKHWGCSPAYVSAVLNGHKRPNRVMLEAIQLTRQVVYLPANVEAKEDGGPAGSAGSAAD